MKSILVALVALWAGNIFAATPKEVADAALEAWDAHDGPRLYALSHPELISRMRTSRLLLFYAERDPTKRVLIASGDDKQVVDLFCDALALVAPTTKFTKSRDYIGDCEAEEFASIFYTQVIRHVSGRPAMPPIEIRVVLRKDGEEWRLLWLPAAQIHIDLTWEPK